MMDVYVKVAAYHRLVVMRLSLVVVESVGHGRDMVKDSPADERFRIWLDGSSLHSDGGRHVLGNCISERYEQSG